MNVDVVIVSHNSERDIARCLASVLGNGAHPVVVDTGSTDATMHLLARDFPGVRVLHSPCNGYARAANLGFANTSSPITILSNADVIFPPRSVLRLYRCLTQHPAIGVLGAQQVFPDGSWQRSWGAVTGAREVIAEALGLTTLMNGARSVLWPRFAGHIPNDVGYVDGAIMAIRRATFDSVSGLDERFWFSSEDADFCVRARQAGWRVAVLPSVGIIHRRGGSSDLRDWSVQRKTAAFVDGTRIFLAKHRGPFFAKWYFAAKRLSNFNLMLLSELARRVAPRQYHPYLSRKAKIHRSYVENLRSGAKQVPAEAFL
ncbi:MAG TPA: glycosyltransferase family 2 protein [Terriglobales bacterium]|nr:glycosyltransferase family 2 protein [Terriglobales bacterium]